MKIIIFTKLYMYFLRNNWNLKMKYQIMSFGRIIDGPRCYPVCLVRPFSVPTLKSSFVI